MSRKDYLYNEASFTADNPNSMYFLGYVVTDGVLEKHHVHIDSKDEQIVSDIRNLVVPEKPLITDKRTGVKRLKISHKPIVDFVRSAGITERKSHYVALEDWVLQSPNFPHLVRGMFDGDGTIGIARNTNGKSKKNYYRPTMVIRMASEKIIQQIQEVLVSVYGLSKNNILIEKTKHGTIMFGLKWQGNLAQRFYDVIYRDANIKLDRKYIRYTNILSLDSDSLGKYHGKGKVGMLPLDNPNFKSL